MTYAELDARLKEMGVVPNDVMRASLYFPQLERARHYFHTDLKKDKPEGLGNGNYQFVFPALTHASLLNTLARALDNHVITAFEAALEWEYKHGHGPNAPETDRWTYDQYFENRILHPDYDEYRRRLDDFYAVYRITEHSLLKIEENFIQNIRTCCERVYEDRLILTRFYDDLYYNVLGLNRLLHIQSSGSDFHKGGQQVLILTFAYSVNDKLFETGELKVVYKPGDLEADCLLMGDSKAINRVQKNFMKESLAEIYNRIIKTEQINAPTLPTYRILPRDFNSKHGDELPLKVRQAYGYIQYLNHDVSWGMFARFGFYPAFLTASDYVIFDPYSEDEIVETFYRKAGVFCALASTFSIIDIHAENFRAYKLLPHPIDLEICLVTAVPAVSVTSLLGDKAGITTFEIPNKEFRWMVINRDKPGLSRMYKATGPKTFENRLFRALPHRETTVIPVDTTALLTGYDRAMSVLKKAQELDAFDEWFARLRENVVVRYLPFETFVFNQNMQSLLGMAINVADRERSFESALNHVMCSARTAYFRTYEDGALPAFLAFLDEQGGEDYFNMDVPVFYHLLSGNSVELVNSRGELVSVPGEITIYVNDIQTEVPCRNRVGRDYYFPNDPTETIVIEGQVIPLGDNMSFIIRYEQLLESMLKSLNLNNAPEGLHNLIQTD